jgi:hypothetical protein
MFAEFEEKEYEIPLYLELADGSPYVWSPGQVLEKSLGLDGTQFTMNATFWKIFGQNPPLGTNLNASTIRRRINRRLPTFRCNLMLQVKRPKYLMYKVRGYTGTSPYFRIDINRDQQNTLQIISRSLSKSAYIGYASPSFYRVSDLYQAIIRSSVISKSNFISVSRLSGHEYWTYSQPGTSGQALSEPEDIKEEAFDQRISWLAGMDEEFRYMQDIARVEEAARADTRGSNLSELVRVIINACYEQRKNEYCNEFITWLERMDSLKNIDNLIKDFMRVQFFCSIFGLMWFVIG